MRLVDEGEGWDLVVRREREFQDFESPPRRQIP
jgi:hypothetical protein